MFRTSLCILFAIGCVKQPEPAATAEAEEAPATEQTEEAAPEVAESATPEDGKWIHYGSEFSVENSVTAATLLDEPSAYMEGVVRVTDATITDVCQAKGCWLVIADGDRNMRIFTKDHGFVVAKDAGGSNCELEGTVVSKTVKKDFVEHLEAESTQADSMPEKGKEEGDTIYEFVASAVRIAGKPQVTMPVGEAPAAPEGETPAGPDEAPSDSEAQPAE